MNGDWRSSRCRMGIVCHLPAADSSSSRRSAIDTGGRWTVFRIVPSSPPSRVPNIGMDLDAAGSCQQGTVADVVHGIADLRHVPWLRIMLGASEPTFVQFDVIAVVAYRSRRISVGLLMGATFVVRGDFRSRACVT